MRARDAAQQAALCVQSEIDAARGRPQDDARLR
jgi:hypothetical protein